MTDIADDARNRLQALKDLDEARKLKNVRDNRLYCLNKNMGRDYDTVKMILFRNACDIAKELALPSNTKAVNAAHEFIQYFQAKKWHELSDKDITMIGQLTAAIVAPVILYDERSYTFYYAEDKPMSAVYDELLEAWANLPWWKRWMHRRPTIDMPEQMT